MSATRTNRFDPFALAQRELDTVFGRLVNGETPAARNNPVDVRETTDGFVVEAELPGFAKSQVEITLENNILTLVADRNLTTEAAGQAEGTVGSEVPAPQSEVNGQALIGYHVRERRSARFERNFKLPPTIDESSISANLENGVLTIKIAKRPETKPRKITVG